MGALVVQRAHYNGLLPPSEVSWGLGQLAVVLFVSVGPTVAMRWVRGPLAGTLTTVAAIVTTVSLASAMVLSFMPPRR